MPSTPDDPEARVAVAAALPLLGGHRGVVLSLWRTRLGASAGAVTAAYQVAFFGGVSLAGVAVGTLLTIGAAPVEVAPARIRPLAATTEGQRDTLSCHR